MLGHADTAGSHDERGSRGDIERSRAVTAGPARVEQIVAGRRQSQRSGAHRPGQPDDLGRALPFHGQADQQTPNLRRCRAALHDLGHGGGRLVDRQVLATHELLEDDWKHMRTRQSLATFRKFCSRRIPPAVMTDSGWNCTPWIGQTRCRSPITVLSSWVSAAISRSAGTLVRSTTSE
jgi:hypothetical protein